MIDCLTLSISSLYTTLNNHLQIMDIKSSFGNVVLVTLFIFFGNTCGWKSVWKNV